MSTKKCRGKSVEEINVEEINVEEVNVEEKTQYRIQPLNNNRLLILFDQEMINELEAIESENVEAFVFKSDHITSDQIRY